MAELKEQIASYARKVKLPEGFVWSKAPDGGAVHEVTDSIGLPTGVMFVAVLKRRPSKPAVYARFDIHQWVTFSLFSYFTLLLCEKATQFEKDFDLGASSISLEMRVKA